MFKKPIRQDGSERKPVLGTLRVERRENEAWCKARLGAPGVGG
jgi:hypothetical protein